MERGGGKGRGGLLLLLLLLLCLGGGGGDFFRNKQVVSWGGMTRSYDLVVGTFDVFWDLFQVLFSGFISGLEGWGGSSQGWFFEYVLVSFFFINFS